MRGAPPLVPISNPLAPPTGLVGAPGGVLPAIAPLGAAAAAGAALRPPGSHASSANSLFSVNEAPPTETFTMDRTGGSLGN